VIFYALVFTGQEAKSFQREFHDIRPAEWWQRNMASRHRLSYTKSTCKRLFFTSLYSARFDL